MEEITLHNPDIESLIKKGYALSIENNYLVVRDVPYLDYNGNLQIGSIVSKMNSVNRRVIRPHDHQIFFCGLHPCEMDGTPIKNLGGGLRKLVMSSEDLVVERTFSNKPPNGFKDWEEKIESYVSIISGPAMDKYDVTPYTFRVLKEKSDSVFKFRDTLTSRAELGDLNMSFKNERIAIIGLGGTGAYLLDFMIKTPVAEIRAFEKKPFHVHNSFRSPGRLLEEELGRPKAEVYKRRYENFRGGLNVLERYIHSESHEDLKGITFAFVCVDKGSSRTEIFKLLMELKIPFIDVGMGLGRELNLLSGTLRTTYFPLDGGKEILDSGYVPMTDLPNHEYENNIQISELNALNASLAVIKYKQLRRFYQVEGNGTHLLYDFNSHQAFAV